MKSVLRIIPYILIAAALGALFWWFSQQPAAMGIEESLWHELKGMTVALHESQQREADLRDKWGKLKLSHDLLREKVESMGADLALASPSAPRGSLSYPINEDIDGFIVSELKMDQSLLDALLIHGPLLWLQRWTELDGSWGQEDGAGRTPLMKALALSPLEVVQWLWPRSDARHRDNAHRSLLHYAVMGEADVLKWLLKKDIELNHLDEKGQSPVHHAVVGGRVDSIQALLDAKVDMDQVDLNGCTPLHVAAQMGAIDIVKILPSHERRDDLGQTPLVKAVQGGHLAVAMAMFKRFDQMLELDEQGASLLHHAVRSGDSDCVEWLLEKGHPLGLQDVDGRNPLHLAAEYGFDDILRALLNAGCSVMAFDALERTPLHIAVVYNHLKAVQILYSWGADPALVDASGQSVEEWEELLKSK